MYFWENHNFGALFFKSRLTLAQARYLAGQMARAFKCPDLRVTHKRLGKRASTAQQKWDHIWVNTDKAHWTPAMLAHEVAHWICDWKEVKGQDHGPVWMGVYLRLLDKFKILPLIVTVPLARAYGIKLKDPRRCF